MDVIIDIAQPLTNFEPVWRGCWGASSGIDEAVEHEKRGERGRFEATIRACDESLEPPGRGPSVPVARRNVELAPHRTNSTPRDTGESGDDSRAHSAAKEAFGERERTYLAVNVVLSEWGFHGATRLAEQYAGCAQKSCRETAENHQIWELTWRLRMAQTAALLLIDCTHACATTATPTFEWSRAFDRTTSDEGAHGRGWRDGRSTALSSRTLANP